MSKNREQDERIAEWLGWTFKHSQSYGDYYFTNGTLDVEYCSHRLLPNFTTSDAEAISLLPTLAGRGFEPALMYRCEKHPIVKQGWMCSIFNYNTAEVVAAISAQPTIASAITSAVLKLIKCEANNVH